MKRILFFASALLVCCWAVLASQAKNNDIVRISDDGILGDQATTQAGGLNKVAMGQYHSLGLDSNNNVWAWGYNGFGQVGDGTSTNRLIPVQVKTSGGANFQATEIAAGFNSSYAVDSSGNAWAWGQNTYNGLGDGTTISRNNPVQVQTASGNLTGVSAISGGQDLGVALDSSGKVWTWGQNQYGQLGNGATTAQSKATKVQVSATGGDFSNVTLIAAGAYHVLAIDNSGQVWAWGHNSSGQLGNGTTTDSYYPVKVQNGSGANFTAEGIAAGNAHSVALSTVSGGTGVFAWGWNLYGQLGDGTTTNRFNPVSTLTSGNQYLAVQIAAGFGHTLALDYTGAGVSAWGYNASGQVGDGTTTNRTNPVAVMKNGAQLSALVLGTGPYAVHSLVGGSTSGTGQAWGKNYYGQLGNNSTTDSSTPVTVLRP